MSLLLDAGALIAYERGHRGVRGLIRLALASDTPIKTSTAVVAQVWRHASKEVELAIMLRGVEEVDLTPIRARAIGLLLVRAARSDVVDASLIELAVDGDEIATSDPRDLRALASASGKVLIITTIT